MPPPFSSFHPQMAVALPGFSGSSSDGAKALPLPHLGAYVVFFLIYKKNSIVGKSHCEPITVD